MLDLRFKLSAEHERVSFLVKHSLYSNSALPMLLSLHLPVSVAQFVVG